MPSCRAVATSLRSRVAVDEDLARVGLVVPREDADEGGLACAVLAQQGDDRAPGRSRSIPCRTSTGPKDFRRPRMARAWHASAGVVRVVLLDGVEGRCTRAGRAAARGRLRP